ncbi:MAG: UDP-N-acetylmuramoyl-L-alanyl-D-glutamate--2,6-diaminopimelate ligase [Pseudomonadota bacterium]
MNATATILLSSLAQRAGLAAPADDGTVTGLTADSRAVQPGMLFAALPGTRVDGTAFVEQAMRSGAAALLVPEGFRPDQQRAIPVLHAHDVRRAFALMAAAYFGRQPETLVAVTGTAGKTSVAGFVRQIWERTGQRAASIGTLGVVRPEGTDYGSLTTPDTVRLHALLCELAEAGITHAALEASSHGLDQRRLDGVDVAAAAFTNLGRDHLDYHPDQNAYFEAKAGLFTRVMERGRPVIVDLDEPWSEKVVARAGTREQQVFSVGSSGADLHLKACHPEDAGQRLEIATRSGTMSVLLPLIGRFQVSNALIAAGLAIVTGTESAAAVNALAGLKGAPGRLERVGTHREGAHVFVDYAHKPDALETVLTTLRPFTRNRLIVVFGAGGDRDPGKRALMGAVAERHADLVIVTDDNPRTEEPKSIREQILAAAPSALEIGDRAEAIGAGIGLLHAGDILVVAGKGHEEGQIVGDEVLPFSDKEAVLEALQQ